MSDKPCPFCGDPPARFSYPKCKIGCANSCCPINGVIMEDAEWEYRREPLKRKDIKMNLKKCGRCRNMVEDKPDAYVRTISVRGERLVLLCGKCHEHANEIRQKIKRGEIEGLSYGDKGEINVR